MYDLLKQAKAEAEARKEKMLCRPMPMGESPMMYLDLPSFYMNAKQLPEIRKWKVDSEYVIKVKVRMRSFSSDERVLDGDVKETASASFDIIGIEPQTK